MKKGILGTLLFLTSCTVNRSIINRIYTYHKPSEILGEPFTNRQSTYIDNMDMAYMSNAQTAYYKMQSDKNWVTADILNYKTGNEYFSDISKTSARARDGYLKINRYAMAYIQDNNNAATKSISYIYKGTPVETPDQYKKLVRLKAKDIYSVRIDKQDSTIKIFID